MTIDADHSSLSAKNSPALFRRSQMRAIAAVLVVAASIAAVVLSSSEPRRAGVNSVPPDAFIETVSVASGPACVRNLTLPPGTAGIRTKLGTFGDLGGPVTLTLTDSAGSLKRRSSVTRFTDRTAPIFRFESLAEGLKAATACYRVREGRVAFAGSPNGNIDPAATLTVGHRPGRGDISMEFIRPGSESLLSMLPTTMKRAALFRPEWVGPWTFYLLFVVALFATFAGIALLYRLGRNFTWGPGSMAVLAAIVFLNAAAWAVLTPAFNVPDELAHFAYVETLDRGELPDRKLAAGDPGNSYLPSTVHASTYTAIGILQVPFARPPWDAEAERRFRLESEGLKRSGDRPYGLTPANSYSPLYYAPALVAYKAAGSSGVFGKLLMVRLFSALLAVISVLLVVLFAREMVPSIPWFAPVAGLAVAFQPMFVHIAGGVNNDNLLVPFATATLYLLARMLRRGATTGVAVAAGTCFALGFLAKPTMVGLAPVMLMAFLVLSLRGGEGRMQRLRPLLAGAAAMLLVLGVAIALFGAGDTQATSLSSGGSDGGGTPSPSGIASYVWQWYLPAAPFMHDFFAGTPPVVSVFVRGFFADFNALDTAFPRPLYGLIALILAALACGAAVAVYRRRDALRDRWPMVALPVVAVTGAALFVNVSSYLMLVRDGAPFAQGRYLFPVMAVFGVLVAAGSLGLGRHRGLIAAGVLIASMAMLNVFGMALSLTRFYL